MTAGMICGEYQYPGVGTGPKSGAHYWGFSAGTQAESPKGTSGSEKYKCWHRFCPGVYQRTPASLAAGGVLDMLLLVPAQQFAR
jgi:hypothetical protein